MFTKHRSWSLGVVGVGGGAFLGRSNMVLNATRTRQGVRHGVERAELSFGINAWAMDVWIGSVLGLLSVHHLCSYTHLFDSGSPG